MSSTSHPYGTKWIYAREITDANLRSWHNAMLAGRWLRIQPKLLRPVPPPLPQARSAHQLTLLHPKHPHCAHSNSLLGSHLCQSGSGVRRSVCAGLPNSEVVQTCFMAHSQHLQDGATLLSWLKYKGRLGLHSKVNSLCKQKDGGGLDSKRVIQCRGVGNGSHRFWKPFPVPLRNLPALHLSSPQAFLFI